MRGSVRLRDGCIRYDLAVTRTHHRLVSFGISSNAAGARQREAAVCFAGACRSTLAAVYIWETLLPHSVDVLYANTVISRLATVLSDGLA